MADFEYVCLTSRPLEIGCCLRGQEGRGLQPVCLEVGAVPASDIMRGGSLVLKILDREGEVLAVAIFDPGQAGQLVTDTGAAVCYLTDSFEVTKDTEGAVAVVGGHHV